jgi:DNA-binding transcriptional LysR family regulator
MRRRELEMRDLRNFLAIAETLHFGRAATKLGIAQPNLSQQIKKMESLLGHALFERTTRGVRLTPVGVLFQRRAGALRANLQDAIETARRVGQGEEGNLVVGFSGSVMFSRFSKVVERFRSSHPKVHLHLKELHANEQIAQLLDGSLDISVIRDGEATEGLEMRTLSRESFIAILPEHHPLARKGKLQPALLKQEPFVLFSPTMARLAFDRTIGLCLAAGFRPNIVQEAPQWATVVSLVGSGMGVSIAPACVARLKMVGVMYRPIHSLSYSTIDIGARSDMNNPAARLLLALAQKEFGTQLKQHL